MVTFAAQVESTKTDWSAVFQAMTILLPFVAAGVGYYFGLLHQRQEARRAVYLEFMEAFRGIQSHRKLDQTARLVDISRKVYLVGSDRTVRVMNKLLASAQPSTRLTAEETEQLARRAVWLMRKDLVLHTRLSQDEVQFFRELPTENRESSST